MEVIKQFEDQKVSVVLIMSDYFKHFGAPICWQVKVVSQQQ